MVGPAMILGAKAAADVSATPVPDKVSPGKGVAFDVYFKNLSSSNIAQLFLDSDTSLATPEGGTLVEVAKQTQGTCDVSSGDLHCVLGAVNAFADVTVRVVYTTPDVTGTFKVPFVFSTTGVAPDPGTNSHGDDYAALGEVTLDASDDFAGEYIRDDSDTTTVFDNQALHARRNPQSTLVFAPEDAIGISVGEATFPCPPQAGTCFGQWSVIYVNDGFDYGLTGGIEVVIGYKGNIGDAQFVHVLDDGTVQLIENECSADPPAASELNPGCFIINTVNGDSFATLWIWQNGRLSGY